MNKANKLPKDIIGKKFGDITITKEFDRVVRPNGTIVRNFEGVCKCGKILNGNYQSMMNRGGCASCNREKRKELRMESILHKKYNRLTIITKEREDGKVLCRCECGRTKWIILSSVVNNITFSCGCLQKERTQEYIINKFSIDNNPNIFKIREDKIKRDVYVTNSVESRILKSIIALCSRTNPKYSKYYLNKQIKVCDRWRGRGGLINFITDMGIRPSIKHKLMRLDNNKDFEPDNCVWYIKEEK